MKTLEQAQQEVDALAQQYIERMRAAHEKWQGELQRQIEECERQKELCRKKLLELSRVDT